MGDKALYNSNTKTLPERSVTQRLRINLRRSVGANTKSIVIENIEVVDTHAILYGHLHYDTFMDIFFILKVTICYNLLMKLESTFQNIYHILCWGGDSLTLMTSTRPSMMLWFVHQPCPFVDPSELALVYRAPCVSFIHRGLQVCGTFYFNSWYKMHVWCSFSLLFSDGNLLLCNLLDFDNV